MIDAILHTASSQWYLVGWVLALLMLAAGFLIGALYYDSDVASPNEETPPDVDPSQKGTGDRA